jgi:PhzF family phenazine biosynthesis protein
MRHNVVPAFLGPKKVQIPIYQVDAFTGEVFHGNPAAVCLLEEWLRDTTLQAIAAENNLSETAFLVSREGGYRIRWFTPATEVNLCGHATLASAHVLLTELEDAEAPVNFHSASGELNVSMRPDGLLELDFPARAPRLAETPSLLTEALRQTPEAVFAADNESGEVDNWLAVFDTEASVAALAPNFTLMQRLDGLGVIATAPGTGVDFVSRYFAPKAGINEDPVTGSAHCTLAPYWAKRLGKDRLQARQISRRGGELQCELAGERVLIAGRAVTYLRGQIEF